GDQTPGRRVGEDVQGMLVLFMGALPEFSAYQELRAGFTAAVSHELRTPLARLLALLESTTLPGADVEALVEQAREEVQQARDLIDDVPPPGDPGARPIGPPTPPTKIPLPNRARTPRTAEPTDE